MNTLEELVTYTSEFIRTQFNCSPKYIEESRSLCENLVKNNLGFSGPYITDHRPFTFKFLDKYVIAFSKFFTFISIFLENNKVYIHFVQNGHLYSREITSKADMHILLMFIVNSSKNYLNRLIVELNQKYSISHRKVMMKNPLNHMYYLSSKNTVITMYFGYIAFANSIYMGRIQTCENMNISTIANEYKKLFDSVIEVEK